MATASKPEKVKLGQVSIYLVRENTPTASILDWDRIEAKAKYQSFNLDLDGVPARLVYFESTATKTNPPWLDFLNLQLGPTQQLQFTAPSRSANGILLLELEGRTLVITFGRSAGVSLKRKALELDFGIRTAMNMCGNEEVRQTRTQSHSVTPTHIDRQVGRPSSTFVFGLSEAEDLRYISAHLKGDIHVTLQGRDHLTVKIASEKKKIDWDGLILRCRGFLKAYHQTDYEKLFPNYRNFQAASDDEVIQLDGHLEALLNAGNLDDLQLWIPEFLPGDEYSFTYTNHKKTANEIYGNLDIAQLILHYDLSKVTSEYLRGHYVYAYSHEEDKIIQSKRWSIYDCLILERAIGPKNFILVSGQWRLIDEKFYEKVISFVKDRVKEEAAEPLYAGISIADMVQKKNREGVFNEEACVKRPQSIKFDQAKLGVGGSKKDKEFCDILDLTDDGVMRIIHCKPYRGSSALSYLFAQARFYCESFVSDQVFLDAIRKHVGKSSTPTKADYLKHIKTNVKDVSGSDYRVCIWLLCNQKAKLPCKTDLPFMAQYELKLMHDRLQQVCKYQEILLRFVPVHQASFVTKAKPKVA